MVNNAQNKTEFDTDPKEGLSFEEVKARQKKYGTNDLPEVIPESFFIILLHQFENPFIYLLVLAALFKLFLQDYPDAGIIIAIVIINGLIGAAQENRAYNVLSSLKKIIKLTCVVVRNGSRKIISNSDLVPGDIIILQEGENVPADSRVIREADLKVNEAMFTGESQAVEKKATEELLMGSALISGNCVAIVTAIGKATKLGQLKQSTEHITNEIPLKKDLDELAKLFLIFTVIASITLFIVGILRGIPLETMILTLTSLFVSIVPKGIPIISTIVLAIGTYRMAQAHVLVKRMTAIETLGRVETLIVDKTGTLTYNEQMILEVFAGDKRYSASGRGYRPQGEITYQGKPVLNTEEPDLIALARACALLDNSLLEYHETDNTFILRGEPIQAALGVFAHKVGVDKQKMQKECPLIQEMPFDHQKRIQGGYFKCSNTEGSYFVGSPEAIFSLCEQKSTTAQEACTSMLARGLRVVALAYSPNSIEKLYAAPMKLLGLCGMQDSIRPGINDLIDQARQAGLRVVMATGDHKDTALYVGTQTGIFKKDRGDEVLEGKDFNNLEEKELNEKLLNTTIIARVTPEDKLAIIRAYHYQGIIVGMTGDGVNDVPALVGADVGIAMGQIGTQVARDAADIILLDDSLQSIFSGIVQGRTIIATLRRVISFLLAINISEVLLIAATLVFDLPLPLLAIQLLWQHLLTDSFLDVGISLEPAEKRIHPPTKGHMKLFDRSLIIKLYIDIATAVGITVLLFAWYAQTNLDLARTMVLVTFSFFQWFNAWNLRSDYKSLFTMNPFDNIWLLIITLAAVLLQIIAVNNAYLGNWLRLTPLTLKEWGIAGLAASLIIIFDEIRKIYVRKEMKQVEGALWKKQL